MPVRPIHLPRELRQDGESKTSQAHVMRKIPQMMLVSAAELLSGLVTDERMHLLKEPNRRFQIVTLVFRIHPRYSNHERINLTASPFSCTIKVKSSDPQRVDGTRDYSTPRCQPIIVGLFSVRYFLAFDIDDGYLVIDSCCVPFFFSTRTIDKLTRCQGLQSAVDSDLFVELSLPLRQLHSAHETLLAFKESPLSFKFILKNRQ